ncbi:MAG: carbohydrate ABC transporter permease [bacterium]|uniref:Sugar ABC transporter permease n=1 Tax=Candidatus Infernicultor aquiphilus TaxID=1805029 RepID=A0A2M8CCD1_9BACT|nr:carbohydrate ABC transporter permease [bacterium]PIU24841.1 MAG: sugar ABC transporter permease [Candidatus Atribacteria bacterium CG08_land_8_20_14_0_20_33_29]PIX34014.1 MAG: sugar ABC transporter permease [Candidatus Atribacteria bacterium CG_4_8_14_3_um_filter_34_18]PJB56727.1 MAG: sugar ABC transporter permease [Candidatus Atribacteria bacterium CG_4_9_14_3_um_filter_33_16]
MKKLISTFSKVPLNLVIIIIALIWILPSVGLLVTSFRPSADVAASGWWTIFEHPFNFTWHTLENYQEVIVKIGIGKAFLNSLLITIPATIIPILIASFAAYAFAWMEFPGRRLLFIILVGLLVVPLQMTMIPVLRIFNKLGMAGTFPGIWLAHTGYGLPLIIYLLYNFISGLPSELFDSSSIDGATSFQIFFKVVIPLSVPALASVTIFQFLWVWNDLLVALVYLGGTPAVAPLTVRISALVGSYGQDWELLTAAAFVSMVLPLVLFLGLQRYFVRGILAGSVKG